MKAIATLLVTVFISNAPILAQSISRFSLQAGYLYSVSTLIRTSPVLISLPDVVAKPGFYAGITYDHQNSTGFTTQLELTYQQKGHINPVTYTNPTSTTTYRYVSITPMAGLRLIKNLRFLVGPQLNLLINRSISGLEALPLTRADHRLEFGVVARASYQVNRVGLRASYFKGLTAYYQPDFYYLTNQNWQLGLFYQLHKGERY